MATSTLRAAAVDVLTGISIMCSLLSPKLSQGQVNDAVPISRGAVPIIALDSLMTDSIPSMIARVRTAGATIEMDSLWNDSIWTWSAACTSPLVLFHFSWNDEVALTQEVPCTKQTEVPALNSTAGLDELQNEYLGSLTMTMAELHQVALQSRSRFTRCFPPISDPAMERILSQLQETFFETDKIRMAKVIASEECLTKQQAQALLMSIASEDRRLELFEPILKKVGPWSKEDLDELFQLSFIKKQALSLLNTP